jgi:hypothetical protein
MTGTDLPTYTREAPGMGAFALSDGVVYHTYSAYARGLDPIILSHYILQLESRRNDGGVVLCDSDGRVSQHVSEPSSKKMTLEGDQITS